LAIKFFKFTLGPLENNSYLMVDLASNEAAVIDPSFGSDQILKEANKNKYIIKQIWCTHAHFDHIGGIDELIPELIQTPEIYLHKKDLFLWNQSGGAKIFGFPFEISIQPSQLIEDNSSIKLGNTIAQTRFTPGHTPGHIIYYIQEENIVFCGDLIFRMSVGRTDLPGGNHLQLLRSIDNHIKTLPDDTRLLSGHGPETTVGFEKKFNPFI